MDQCKYKTPYRISSRIYKHHPQEEHEKKTRLVQEIRVNFFRKMRRICCRLSRAHNQTMHRNKIQGNVRFFFPFYFRTLQSQIAVIDRTFSLYTFGRGIIYLMPNTPPSHKIHFHTIIYYKYILYMYICSQQ